MNEADYPDPQALSSGQLEDAILALKKHRNAVILAHYYQDDDIQDIADFIGDSLDLSRKAASTDSDVIAFCGVRFMAEVAKILSPEKKVVLPDMEAGCSLETSCPPDAFTAFKQAHPDHMVLTYINCSADIKALSDIIVTSSNAEKIINSLPADAKIIFAPDKHLGAWLNKKTDRNMVLWNGSCMVHERFSEKELIKLKVRHTDAVFIAHPECPDHILTHAVHIGSTSSLLNFVKTSSYKKIIVGTEPGILHQMHKQAPDKTLIPLPGNDGSCFCNDCPYMKLNTMQKLYLCLRDLKPEIHLTPEKRLAALKPLKRMLELS